MAAGNQAGKVLPATSSRAPFETCAACARWCITDLGNLPTLPARHCARGFVRTAGISTINAALRA